MRVAPTEARNFVQTCEPGAQAHGEAGLRSAGVRLPYARAKLESKLRTADSDSDEAQRHRRLQRLHALIHLPQKIESMHLHRHARP